MAIKLRILRFAAASDAAQYTGPSGQLVLALDTKQVFVHDGAQAGGHLVGLSEAAVGQLIDTALQGLTVESIGGLVQALGAKASTEDLQALESSLTEALAAKADSTAVSQEIADAVAGLATAQSVTDLATEVGTKAAKTYVDEELAKKVGKTDLFEGETSIIKASLLPSYVDDVLEFADLESFPEEGETGKIYVAVDTNKIYRWSGSTYIDLASPEILALASNAETVALEINDKAVSPAGLGALVAELGFVKDGDDWVLDEGQVDAQ